MTTAVHDEHLIRDRFDVAAHLRAGHNYRPTVAGQPDAVDSEQWRHADGGWVLSDSELLATHRELHELDALG